MEGRVLQSNIAGAGAAARDRASLEALSVRLPEGSSGGQSAISQFRWRRRHVDDRDGWARSPRVEIAPLPRLQGEAANKGTEPTG